MTAWPTCSTGIRSSDPLPRRRLSAGDRRREIVAAVLALACERGPDAITTQAIAERIGVTQGALFRHFADKPAIWLAVLASIRESLATLARDAAEPTGDGGASPLAVLRRLFLGHVAFVARNPGVPRFVFHELQYPDDTPVRAEARAMVATHRARLAGLLADAQRAGEIAAHVDPQVGAMLLIGVIQGLVVQSAIDGGTAVLAVRARPAWDLLVAGLVGGERH